MRLSRLFAVTSILFLAVLAISPAKNALRPYHALQRRYRALGEARARDARSAAAYAQLPAGIHQVWLRDFDAADLRVDRCTTCHLGVADPAMGAAPGGSVARARAVPEPFRLHPRTAHTPADLDRFGCTVCHGGQGAATAAADAHGSAPEAGPPMLPLRYLDAGCGRCHGAESVGEAPVLSRGRELLAKYACYACHAVRGHEGFRPEAPPLAALPAKTGARWLARWLADPRAVDPNATMPNFQLSGHEIAELSHYLFGQSVPAELAQRIAAAEVEPAGDPASGKKLFAESRCISCHTVEGKGNGSAPELSKVASSATRGWLLAFLREPQAFNPRTRMPRYHLSESESRDVVAYLEDELRDFDAPKDILTPLRVNQTLAERGAALFRRAGCTSCHAERGGAGERFGPDLDGLGDKPATALDFGRRTDLPRTLPAWLAAKVTAPRSFAPGLRMPSFALGGEDTQAVVTALLALGAKPVPAAYQPAVKALPALLPGGKVGELIDRYRCLSCHRIGDRGGDISTAPLTYEGSKVKREWLENYLVLSYSLRPILEERMPVLRLPREEAAELAAAISSFYVDPAIPEAPFAGRPPADADPAEGARLYTTLGCRACHITGGSGGSEGNKGGYYGPPLSDSAARLKPGWVFTWLKGPQRWRADVRCPSYGLTDTDALRLTAYLETLRSAPSPASGTAAAPAGGAP